jgi:hypothetical protein
MAAGGIDSDPSGVNDESHQDGDIRVEYHPTSGRRLEEFRFEEFKRVASTASPLPEDKDPEPWRPFKTRVDFEFAALAQDARMSKAQVNKLISLFHRCIKGGDDSFTISSHDEMRDNLKVASERLPKVRVPTILYVLSISDLHHQSLKR